MGKSKLSETLEVKLFKSPFKDRQCCCIKEWLWHRRVDAAEPVFGLCRREVYQPLTHSSGVSALRLQKIARTTEL